MRDRLYGIEVPSVVYFTTNISSLTEFCQNKSDRTGPENSGIHPVVISVNIIKNKAESLKSNIVNK